MSYQNYIQPASWKDSPMEPLPGMTDQFSLFFVAGRDGTTSGLFTGYYEPEVKGSIVKDEKFRFPLYGPPNDLITQPNTPDTGQPGRTAYGRIWSGKLSAHFPRNQIEAGVLEGQGLEIIYLEDEIEAFFLHVQGSGCVLLPDGKRQRVGFAGKNGQPYTAIGRILKERGLVENPTMQAIKDYLRQHPESVREVFDTNTSFVFFKLLQGEGPVGAGGEVLKAESSMAIDDTIWPYGVQVIIECRDPLYPAKPFVRLMKTADTGSAIRGLIRGDIFFGTGEKAGAKAGAMNSKGQMWVLLPRR